MEVDLSPWKVPNWALVDPKSGEARTVGAKCTVPARGAILVPQDRYLRLKDAEAALDARFPRPLPGPAAAGGPPRDRDLIRDFDRNGDGVVSADEFPGPRPVFLRLDVNRDGVIDRAEAEADKGRARDQ